MRSLNHRTHIAWSDHGCTFDSVNLIDRRSLMHHVLIEVKVSSDIEGMGILDLHEALIFGGDGLVGVKGSESFNWGCLFEGSNLFMVDDGSVEFFWFGMA